MNIAIVKSRWGKVVDLEFYTEGPALDEAGNLYVSTMTGGIILRIDRSGRTTEWARLSCPNGHRILKNGHHIVCDTNSSSVVELDPDGKIIGIISGASDPECLFDTPNDLVADDWGGFYFTDSVRKKGQVFYVDRERSIRLVASGLDYPNGIALSPDGSQLYIAESSTNRILVTDLEEAGRVKSEPAVFADLPRNPRLLDPDRMPYTANLPDGIAWDQQGRLWVAHYGMGALQVLDREGRLIGTISTGIPATSNLCFGPDGKTLYVTGGYGEPGPGCVHQVFID